VPAVRVGQPAVLGELLAGILLGNLPGLGILHFIAADPYVDILSRIGMLLLLFGVGVELSVRDLFSVGGIGSARGSAWNDFQLYRTGNRRRIDHTFNAACPQMEYWPEKQLGTSGLRLLPAFMTFLDRSE